MVYILRNDVSVRTSTGKTILKPGKVGAQGFSCRFLGRKLYVSYSLPQRTSISITCWNRRRSSPCCSYLKKCPARRILFSTEIGTGRMEGVAGGDRSLSCHTFLILLGSILKRAVPFTSWGELYCSQKDCCRLR